MIYNKSILAVIPARKGSKKLPKKNILSLAGKPMIVWTINEALKSKYIDNIIVSTNDEEVINICSSIDEIEVPFKRPECLSKDSSST